MRLVRLLGGLALFTAIGVLGFIPPRAHAAVSYNVGVCDPKAPLNCVKPAADGSISVTNSGGSLSATVNAEPLSGLPDGSSHAESLTPFAAVRHTLNDPVTGLDISFQDNRQTDTTLNSATSNATFPIALNGSLATGGITIAGLTASGATLTPECLNNGAAVTPQWTTCRPLTGESVLVLDGNYRWDVAGRTNFRLRVSTTGTGTLTFSSTTSGATSAPPVSLSSGILRPIVQADARPFLNMTTNTTTKIITGVAGKKTYVTGYSLRSGGITTGKLVSGTGANCGTGTADLTETFDLAANDGQVIGGGLGELFEVAAATDVCAVNSAAQNLRVSISMTQQP